MFRIKFKLICIKKNQENETHYQKKRKIKQDLFQDDLDIGSSRHGFKIKPL